METAVWISDYRLVAFVENKTGCLPFTTSAEQSQAEKAVPYHWANTELCFYRHVCLSVIFAIVTV